MPEWMPSAKAEINPNLNWVLRSDSGAAKLPSIFCLHLHLKAKIKMKNKNESRGNQFILPVQPKLSRQSLLVPCPSPWPDSPGLRRDTRGRWASGLTGSTLLGHGKWEQGVKGIKRHFGLMRGWLEKHHSDSSRGSKWGEEQCRKNVEKGGEREKSTQCGFCCFLLAVQLLYSLRKVSQCC